MKWVTVLCRAYDKEADEAMLEAYAIGLEGLAPERIEAGARAAIRQGGQFMPSPAKLRKLAGAQPPEGRAAEAWAAALRAIGTHGHRRAVDFDDAGTTNAAIRRVFGGWGSFCRTTSDALPFRKRDFVEAYVELAASGAGDRTALAGDGGAECVDGLARPVLVPVAMFPLPGNQLRRAEQRSLCAAPRGDRSREERLAAEADEKRRAERDAYADEPEPEDTPETRAQQLHRIRAIAARVGTGG
jgi:hypothetical protein